MLDKADRRYLRSSDPTAIVGNIQGTVYQSGIQLQQTAPNIWIGRGNQASYAIVPKLAITISPVQDAVCVDVRVTADFESNGIIIFALAWIFFFPAAVILAILGYQDFGRRAQWILSAIWTPLSAQMINPPAPAWPPQMPAAPIPPTAYGPPPGPGYGPPR